MPTYQYACTACGHQLEAVQSFADEPLTQCPSCEGRLRKVFNSVGIVFKGSGFYRTDSRKGNGSDSPSDSSPAKSTAANGGSGSDSSGSSNGSSGSAEKSSGGSDKSSGSSGGSTAQSGSSGGSGGSSSTSASAAA